MSGVNGHRTILISWTCPRCRETVYEDECQECGQPYEAPRNGYTLNGAADPRPAGLGKVKAREE
jgi:hypothetical protein